jgi:hypothetical protein
LSTIGADSLRANSCWLAFKVIITGIVSAARILATCASTRARVLIDRDSAYTVCGFTCTHSNTPMTTIPTMLCHMGDFNT